MAPKRSTKAKPAKTSKAASSGVSKSASGTRAKTARAATSTAPSGRRSARLAGIPAEQAAPQAQAAPRQPAPRQRAPPQRAPPQRAPPQPAPPQPAPQAQAAATQTNDGANTADGSTVEASEPLALIEPPLFATSGEQTITFRSNNVMLGTSLTIKNTRTMTDVFLGYRFDITVDGEEAGNIDAFRISKPNESHPALADDPWENLLLKQDLSVLGNEHAMDVLQKEAGLMTQALWTRAGNLRGSVLNTAKQPLADRKLLYVQMVHIEKKFQQGGLLTTMFNEFYNALTVLPEWFAMHHAVAVLVPDPTEAFPEDFGSMSDDEIRAKLQAIYTRNGYDMYIRNFGVGKGSDKEEVTVMGKILQ